MKKIIIIPFICLASIVIAQTATSVNNGNWLSPMTWDCTCVPTPGYTVTINHNVTLNTSFGYTSGGITINSSGSLIQDATPRDMLVNGGSFVNNGTFNVRYLFTQAGTFSNGGNVTLTAFLNYLNFTNTGTFQNIDSIYTTGNITNNGSFLNIDSITNVGTFINNGTCVFNQFTNNQPFTNNNNLTFTDITNNSTLINNDTMINLHSSYNTGKMQINSGSYFEVMKSFLNQKPVAKTASLIVNGVMEIHDSWYNYDTTRGTLGGIIVTDTTLNYGLIKNTIDICDLTPPATSPYIDFNFGTIDPGVTYCVLSVNEIYGVNGSIYPNPASNYVIVKSDLANYKISLNDLNGRVMFTGQNEKSINIAQFENGIYLLKIESENHIEIHKLQILK